MPVSNTRRRRFAWDTRKAYRGQTSPSTSSDVEIAHVERVLFDELAPRLDQIAHQLREDAIGLFHLFDLHLEKVATLRIHRRLPELLRVHLAQAFVALELEALATESIDLLRDLVPALDVDRLV